MKNAILHIMILFLLIAFSMKSEAQNWVSVSLNQSGQIELEKRMLNDSSNHHMDVFHKRLSPHDSLAKRFSQYDYESDDFYFRFYPEFNLAAGMQEENQFVSNNHVGFFADLSYGKENHFVALHTGSAFYAGLQPYYMRLLMQTRRIIPGLWSGESINRTWNTAWEPEVILHYQTPFLLQLETGVGKQHIGNGYRSLILSENAPAFPYARLATQFAKVNYHIQWMLLENHPHQAWTDPDTKKLMMMHYLSWNIGKRINLGCFESIVWSNANDRLLFETQYLNPLIFFRPVEFSLGSSDNALMGINLSVKAAKNIQVYGQFVLDDIQVGQFINDIKYQLGILAKGETYGWFGNKYGGQIGLKYFDAFGLNGLFIQSEFNAVRPLTYAHNNVNQAYTHSYQALAHPLGSNFIESFSRLAYRYKSMQFGVNFMYAKQGVSPINTNMGENIFYPVSDGPGQAWIPVSTYGNLLLQGDQLDIYHLVVDISWMPLGNSKLELFAQGFYRKSIPENSVSIRDCGIYLGGRTQISRLNKFF